MDEASGNSSAYCGECDHVFAYEERELFSGEVFCPGCSSRVVDHYRVLSLARRAHRRASVYRDPETKRQVAGQ